MIIFEKPVQGVSTATLQRFVRLAQRLMKVHGEVNVLLAGNQRLKELNRRFRRKNKPTDVLSFPRTEGGDIAISIEISRANALRYGHSHLAELKILVLHGMLHLAGHDHETDHGRMARLEIRLRNHLKLPASLIDRTTAAPSTRSATKKAKTATAKRSATSRSSRRRLP